MKDEREIPLLETKELKKYFPAGSDLSSLPGKERGGSIKAVDGVSLSLKKGSTLGLVGESGCGKSTFARLVLRLIEPDSGEVIFEGASLTGLSREEVRLKRKKMQIIFQDPYASLNPRLSAGSVLSEILSVNGYSPENAAKRTEDLFDLVGIDRKDSGKYPHEFSGGQRQRIGIARAIAINPDFIVADEPVSSLDVSIQAQIINLMADLQEKLSLTYLFISHDLGIVRHISTSVAVMYKGSIMETATTEELYSNPLHPYTRMLLSSIPEPGMRRGARPGNTRSENKLSDSTMESCKFAPRCSEYSEKCSKISPDLKEVRNSHLARCIKY